MSYIKFCIDNSTNEKQIHVYPNRKPWMSSEVWLPLRVHNSALKTGDKALYSSTRADLRRGTEKKPRRPRNRRWRNIFQTTTHIKCVRDLNTLPNTRMWKDALHLAFKTIIPNFLVRKLAPLDFCPTICVWIKDFLINCPQLVETTCSSTPKKPKETSWTSGGTRLKLLISALTVTVWRGLPSFNSWGLTSQSTSSGQTTQQWWWGRSSIDSTSQEYSERKD